MVFSKDGIEPDPKKIDALIIMTPPTSVGEVQSLLGMTNVLARFFSSLLNHNSSYQDADTEGANV